MVQRWALLACCLLPLVGCQSAQTARSQSPAEEPKESDSRTVGDVTAVANADPITVYGIGLVVGLDGTGSPVQPGPYRTALEEQLKKKNVSDLKAVLNTREHSLVLVTASIPAGARKGDPLDVAVALPPGSKTTSLRGGYLTECTLYNYSSAKGVSPDFTGPDVALKGHPLAKAEGALVTGMTDGDKGHKVGMVWGGGRSGVDRPFWLVLNLDHRRVQVAMRAAERINESFGGGHLGGDKLAEAKDRERVALAVPPQYKHNLPRFLRVVRLVPLDENPAPDGPYRRKLADQLLDPAATVTAALRLEALGTESVGTLKSALSSAYPLVRFSAAEALAYLGQPSAGEELARLLREQPMLQTYCLTALASLDEAVSYVKLTELMGEADPVVRYGAFRALRALDEQAPAVRGELLNESFWLHTAAPSATPLAHVRAGKRAEVVLFGEGPALVPPFSFLAGSDFTVTAARGDTKATISRFSTRDGMKRRQCGLALADVLKSLADMGGDYPDAVELLRQADKFGCLSCQLAIDALPTESSVQQLAASGRDNPTMARGTTDVVKARDELGETPNLFERTKGAKLRPKVGAEDEEELTAAPPARERPTASRK